MVVIGEGDSIVFDWEFMMILVVELMSVFCGIDLWFVLNVCWMMFECCE